MHCSHLLCLLLITPLLWACQSHEDLSTEPASVSCGGCHPEQYADWERSPLARAGTRSPVFTALVKRVEQDWGSSAADACQSCHQPEHVPGEEGISCISCHAAIGNRGEHDGRLILDLGRPLMGPTGLPSSEHGARSSELLRSDSLCGTCHEVTGPNLFVETTLTDHRSSLSAAAGETCVDCHMPAIARAPIATTSTVARRRVDHSFVGIDPPWGASPEEASAAAADTRDLLATALQLSVERSAPDQALVHLENVGAGHRVPTGVTLFRDIWVDVEFIDAEGTLHPHTRVIELGSTLWNGEEEVVVITEADRVVDQSLGQGEQRTASIPLDPTWPRPLTIRGTLYVRAFRPELLEALGLGDRLDEVPIHTVAEASAL